MDSPDNDLFDSMSAGRFLGIAESFRQKNIKNKKKRSKALRKFLNPKSRSEEYRAYMDSDKWHKFRLKIIAQRHAACERCGERNVPFHVHHISYAHFGNELDEDVLLLCVPCHQKRHMDKPTFWK